MSMPVDTYTCLKCDLKTFEPGFGLRFAYQVGDDSVLVKYRIGWCYNCSGFAPIEHFDTLAKLTQWNDELKDLKAGLAKKQEEIESTRRWWQRYGPGSGEAVRLQSQIDEIQRAFDTTLKRLLLLANRVNPPRCLSCGSTHADAFDSQPQFTVYFGQTQGPIKLGMKHPGCGGELAVLFDGLRISYTPTCRMYDIEGSMLPIPEEYDE